jgi:hypothetical protein
MKPGVGVGEFVAWAHRRRKATVIIWAFTLTCLAVPLILGLMRTA